MLAASGNYAHGHGLWVECCVGGLEGRPSQCEAEWWVGNSQSPEGICSGDMVVDG